MKDTPLDDENLEERQLCSNCVGEPYLVEQIESNGSQTTCHYCGEIGSAVNVEWISDRVKQALEQHYSVTATEPSDYEYAWMRVEDRGWERSGYQIRDVIADIAQVRNEVANDIRQVLEEKYSNPFEEGESPFEEEAHYEEQGVEDAEFQAEWIEFESRLKKRNRFFGLEQILSRVFDRIAAYQTAEGSPIIIECGPGLPLAALFRARVFQSDETLRDALGSPEIGLGPPPIPAARDGRMNARGVSVFYGATSSPVAIAEVRPPMASQVLVGQFSFIRAVRLLDVEALRKVLIKGSVFDPAYVEQLQHAKFLNTLSHQITRPVMPDDEPFDYLVTQAIADYLAASPLALDGIIYPSVWADNDGKNVVLFNKVAKVQPVNLPEGSRIQANTSTQTEDGYEREYRVTDVITKKKGDGTPGSPPASFWGELRAPLIDETAGDERVPTLHLERESLAVHVVARVTIETKPYEVYRHRVEDDGTGPKF